MFAVLSPAKKLDFETAAPIKKVSSPRFQNKAFELIKVLRKCSQEEVSKLMKLSDSLSELNKERYKKFKEEVDPKQSKQAVYCFAGDTYKGLQVHELSAKDVEYAQKHLGILSGLYGLIRPLDLIQPYRLEMGTKLKCGDSKNLYEYWKGTLTDELNKILKKEKYLINLASQEYFGAVDEKNLKASIVTPVFKEKKNGEFKVVGFYAKKARGMMARFIIENQIETPDALKKFNEEGYEFNPKLSNDKEYVFTR